MGYIATRTQENFTFLASDLWRKQLHQLSSVKCRWRMILNLSRPCFSSPSRKRTMFRVLVDAEPTC